MYFGIAFRVKAEKEGFVLTGPDENGNFNAQKLAEVIVEVLDKADGKSLQVSYLYISLKLNKLFLLHSCPYTTSNSRTVKKAFLCHQFILQSHNFVIALTYLTLEKPCLHQALENQED